MLKLSSKLASNHAAAVIRSHQSAAGRAGHTPALHAAAMLMSTAVARAEPTADVRNLKLLVVDGYDRAGVERLESVGAAAASDLMKRLLGNATAGIDNLHVDTDVVNPALRPRDLPSPCELKEAYDGVAWTGSSLTIYDPSPVVTRQIDFARECYVAGVPQFGSCWGLQVAAAAVGIPTCKNPLGREQGLGLGGAISLTPTGQSHLFYGGKANLFHGLMAHTDHVCGDWAAKLGTGTLGAGVGTGVGMGVGAHGPYHARVLSGNAHSPVQALAVSLENGGEFWATQYHTEYNLQDVADLTVLANPTLLEHGIFKSAEAVDEYAAVLAQLHADPSDQDLRERLCAIVGKVSNKDHGQDHGSLLDFLDKPEHNHIEAANWLKHLVLPTLANGGGGIKSGFTSEPEAEAKASTTAAAAAKAAAEPIFLTGTRYAAAGAAAVAGNSSGASRASQLAHELGWEVVPVSDALGVELLGANLSKERLGSKELAAIEEALLEHQVVFFRDQHDFGPEDHKHFASSFGGLQDTHPAYPYVDGFREITILENDRERPSLIEKWHTDMTFRPNPPLGSILHGVIIPEGGLGDTEFLSLSAALEALPDDLKTRLAGLEAEHSFEHGFRESLAAPGGRERLAAALRDNPPVYHPVVRTHPTSGRQCLFVNCLFTTKIVGMEDAESDALLQQLFEHVEKEEFRCRFKWQENSVAFWDNRITQHRPVNDYWPHHRKLQRITIDGDRPFYAP